MRWARIENGRVLEFTDIDPEGRFPPGVYNWQPCTEETYYYWAATQDENGVWVFAPYVPPPLTPEQILDKNRQQQYVFRLNTAFLFVPMIENIDLGDSPEAEAARPWQTYFRELGEVDLTVENPVWPVAPEPYLR